jgi:hypothetical protein
LPYKILNSSSVALIVQAFGGALIKVLRLWQQRVTDNFFFAKNMFSTWKNSKRNLKKNWCARGVRWGKRKCIKLVLQRNFLNKTQGSYFLTYLAIQPIFDLGLMTKIPPFISILRSLCPESRRPWPWDLERWNFGSWSLLGQLDVRFILVLCL